MSIDLTHRELAQSFGAALRAARESTGSTPEAAAEILGVSADSYGRLEAGMSLPSILVFAKSCTILGVDPCAAIGVSFYASKLCAARNAARMERERADEQAALIADLRAELEITHDRLRVTAVQRDDLRTELADVQAQGAMSIAALRQECEELQTELGRVRRERDELMLMAQLDAEDPDVDVDNPAQLRLGVEVSP